MNNEQEKVEPFKYDSGFLKTVKVEPSDGNPVYLAWDTTTRSWREVHSYQFFSTEDKDRWMLFTTPQPCPDCASRANGSSVLVPSVELKKMQEEIAQQAERINELESDLSLLKPDPKCDGGCMLSCSMEGKAVSEQLAAAQRVIALCEEGLRQWHVPENRYAALDAIAAQKVASNMDDLTIQFARAWDGPKQ